MLFFLFYFTKYVIYLLGRFEMKLLKKTSLALLSFLFVLSMALAFNTNLESVFADTYSISIGGTPYTSLQDAIDAVPYDTETEIQISGNISVASEITIAGDNALGIKKLILNFVADTNITRANTDKFIMLNINSLSNVTIKTSNNAKVVFDGNLQSEALETINSSTQCSIISISDSTFSINGDITFQNNYSYRGGAINALESSKITLDGITFQNNKVQNNGGALNFAGSTASINNCQFLSNIGGARGGAIVSQGTLTLTNSNFDGNNLQGYTHDKNSKMHGGTLTVMGGTTTITNCEFKNSYADDIKDERVMGYGGAIEVYNSGTLNIISASFDNNETDYGGAIAVTGGTLNITDMTMTNNTALKNGGGIYHNGGTVKINNGTISDNTATEYGNDIYWVAEKTSASYISANIASENIGQSIYVTKYLAVGENFALGNGSSICFANDIYVIVNEKLLTTNPIKLYAENTDDNDLVGENLVYFKNQAAITQDVFMLRDPTYSLVLPAGYESLSEPYLLVSAEYIVEFYQYYDAETDTYYNKIGSTQKVPFGASVTPPTTEEVGTREGFRFGGWNTTDYTYVTDHLTVYGIWGVEIEISYKIFNDSTNSWELVDSEIIVSGTKPTNFPTIPPKTGYTVHPSYWAYDTEGSTAYNNENIDDATTLYAIYVPDVLKVTFIHENGTTEEIEVEYNTAFTATIPTIASKIGYDQVTPYWAYDEAGDEPFDASRLIKSNFNLYEIYVINKYTVEFYVNYYHNLNAEGGKELLENKKISEIICNYNDIVSSFPGLPVNVAFTQNSVVWNYNNAPITENLVIYGDIDINVYLVKFEADGEIINSYNIEHGKTLTEIPEIPEKTGYTQTAPVWSLEGASTTDAVTSNRTFKAKYTQNIYTVTFILPDGNRVERNVRHGETVDGDNIIQKNFGELVRFDKSLDNITADCEIKVSKINLFMWIMIAFGCILLIILLIIVIKIIKKKKLQSIARKKHKQARRVGPFVTGDDE